MFIIIVDKSIEFLLESSSIFPEKVEDGCAAITSVLRIESNNDNESSKEMHFFKFFIKTSIRPAVNTLTETFPAQHILSLHHLHS